MEDPLRQYFADSRLELEPIELPRENKEHVLRTYDLLRMKFHVSENSNIPDIKYRSCYLKTQSPVHPRTVLFCADKRFSDSIANGGKNKIWRVFGD